MAYNEELVDRVRELIAATHQQVEEKKMFGGLCFMVNDKMCLGVRGNQLLVRQDPTLFDELMEKDGCMPMAFTGKQVKGLVWVDDRVLKTKKQLSYWTSMALEFNPFAKAAKKKKRGSK